MFNLGDSYVSKQIFIIIMKAKILLFALALLTVSVNGFNTNCTPENIYQIEDFNYLAQVDFDANVEIFEMEEQNVTGYVFQMKDSNDFLIAYGSVENEKLQPVAFGEINSGKTYYKDINTRERVVTLNYGADNQLVSYDYDATKDSKVGLALARGCMGGSTLGCIETALDACLDDTFCAIGCAVVLAECVSAIAIACAVHCNT